MSPQLVDFNADGHKDFVVGTFEGVAFLVPGSKDGFRQPERMLDKNGELILLTQFWNRKTNKWDNTTRSFGGEPGPKQHCISVVAVDWDDDGDLDLLLGAKTGELYMQVNEGKAGAPKFTGRSAQVMAGESAFKTPGGLTAPRVVDWDGDGRPDLVCGSFNGGVYWYRNGSKRGPWHLEAAVELVPGGGMVKTGENPERQVRNAYVDAVDYDGDGDLDLLVGGLGVWMPKARELTAEEQLQAKALKAKLQDLQQQLQTVLQQGRGKKLDRSKYDPIRQKMTGTQAELDKLVPRKQQLGFVWLYERL